MYTIKDIMLPGYEKSHKKEKPIKTRSTPDGQECVLTNYKPKL